MSVKRAFTLLLGLLLCASLAFASGERNQSADIKVSYSIENPEPAAVYSVDLTWGSMEFVYSPYAAMVWNPDTLMYEIPAGSEGTSGWVCAEGANVITAQNHSNVAVSIALRYNGAEGFPGITGTFDRANFSLAAPTIGSQQDQAPKGQAALTLSGALPSSQTQSVAIGSVTVTLQSSNSSVHFDADSYSYTGNNVTNVYSAQVDATLSSLGSGIYQVTMEVGSMTKDGVASESAIVGFSLQVGDVTYYITPVYTNGNYLGVNNGSNYYIKPASEVAEDRIRPIQLKAGTYVLTLNTADGTITYTQSN